MTKINSTPSNDPNETISQLEVELKKLAAGDVANPLAYRPYLLQLVGQVWQAVAEGRFKFVEEQYKRLDHVRWVMDDYLTPELDPRVYAAIEVLETRRNLGLATKVVARIECLTRQLEPDEVAVLRVLDETGRYLSREDVHAQLKNEKVRVERIGALLSQMWDGAGYLMRYQSLDEKRRLVSFYAIAPDGKVVLSHQHKDNPK